MTTRKYHRKSKKSKKIFRKTRSKKGGVTTRRGTDTSKVNKTNTKPKTPSPSPEKESVDDCPICTEPMDNVNDLVTTKPCNHTFHQDCLRSWCQSQTNTKCPLCRTLIPDTCETDLGVGVQASVAERDIIVARIRNGDSSNLEGAHLNDANLTRANLRGANLEGANLNDADLTRANLEGANLEGAHLEGAHLNDADLTRANLRGANLRGAYFHDADLTGADLRGANLEDASLRGADLEDANLRGANLAYADFEDAILVYGTIFGNNTGEPLGGLPYYINLNGGKRKTKPKKNKRKSKKSKRKHEKKI